MKSSTRTQHLTDVEFSDLLAGEQADTATEAHLAACDYCRTELDAVKESLGSFSGLSSRWAEATAPARVPVPSRWTLGLVAGPSWATGLAVIALTGLLVFNYSTPANRAGALGNKPVPVVAAVPPSNAELADDNQLMLSIDQELSSHAQPTVSPSALRTGAHAGVHHGPDAVVD